MIWWHVRNRPYTVDSSSSIESFFMESVIRELVSTCMHESLSLAVRGHILIIVVQLLLAYRKSVNA